MRSRRPVIATTCVLILFGTVAGGVAIARRESPIVFRIPPGTVAGAEAGRPETIIPDSVYVDLRRTNRVIIANDDDRPFLFGSAMVEPGQSLVQRFEVPGVYLVMCGLRAGQIRFVVLGPDGTTNNLKPAP